eukprot:c56179_g1_i1 orf=174-335(+)
MKLHHYCCDLWTRLCVYATVNRVNNERSEQTENVALIQHDTACIEPSLPLSRK